MVRDGTIIGEGWNRVLSRNDPTAHAEVTAIREACTRIGSPELRGAVLYASCEPCPMCLAAILWARIGRIYYANTRVDAAAIGFDDDYFYREVAKPMDRLDVPASRLLPEEARAVFSEWDARPDKVRY